VRFVPREEATKIIEEHDPGDPARIAWRAAAPGEGHGMAVLDLSSGRVMPYSWPADKACPGYFWMFTVLVWCHADARTEPEETWELPCGRDLSGMSDEVIEEELVALARREGLNRPEIERGLKTSYSCPWLEQ
jgi:hypothetical protein